MGRLYTPGPGDRAYFYATSKDPGGLSQGSGFTDVQQAVQLIFRCDSDR